MRIIGGRFRSRKLHAPPDARTTRPIPDRVKESLFNLLRGHFEGARVVDCFAGTGSIGLEALSRGAEHCVFVERDKRACDLLERNFQTLGCSEQATLVKGDALGPAVLTRIAAMGGVDLIFMDPPYPLVRDPSPAFGGEGGWDRVRAQAERLIAVLNPKGFAMIRTPWPFRHADLSQPEGTGSPAEPGTMPAHRKGKPRHSPKPRLERSWVIGSGSVGDAIDLDQIEESSRRLEQRLRKNERAGDPSGAGLPPGGLGKRHLTIDDLDDEDDDQEIDVSPDDPQAGLAGDAGFDDDQTDADAVEQSHITYHDADLTIPGAIGPETHFYGSTAVHLYMRQP